VPSGRIEVRWTEVPDGKGDGVELIWTETGGPTVGVPAKRGFGSMLIQQNLSRSLESEVELRFEQDGVNCRIVIPQPHLYSVFHEPETSPS
jgi:two-component sensor histidine kinase